MHVDLSSAATISPTVTTTPYSPATFVSTEDAGKFQPVAPSPSEGPKTRSLSLPADSEDAVAVPGEGAPGSAIAKRGTGFSDTVQAPGEQQAALRSRHASMRELDGVNRNNGDGGAGGERPTIDRITARRALLTSAQRSTVAEGAAERATISRSDPSVGEPTGAGGGETTRPLRARAGYAAEGSYHNVSRHTKNLDESDVGLLEGAVIGAHSFTPAGLTVETDCDGRSQSRRIGSAALSPVRSPMRGQLRSQSAHGIGATATSSFRSGDKKKVVGVNGAGPDKDKKSGERTKSSRSWASLIGMGPNIDLFHDGIGGGERSAGADGVVGAGRSGSGVLGSSNGGDVDGSELEVQEGRVPSTYLNSPMAQIMVGLYDRQRFL